VLEAATRAFARDGAQASLKAIAKDAGVGIGTLYRRFPTREKLIWAIYRSDVERICVLVPTLLARWTPAEALRRWMGEFIDFLATKRGLADALKAALATDDGFRLETRGMLTTAIAAMLEAGSADGSLRPDVAALDVLMALGGTSLIAGEREQHEQAARLLDLLMAALTH
jgi:AcrR family transcriptional regulator